MSFYRTTATHAGAICLALTIPALPVQAASPASATEFCVSCDGPDAHYACTYDGITADPGDSRLQLFCITELAKSGKHASCSVDRAQKSPCAGEPRKLATPGGYDLGTATVAEPPADTPADTVEPAAKTAPTPAAPKTQAATETKVPKTEAPPKTVEEMVEKSAESASKAITQSNEKVGEAASATGSAFKAAGQAVGNAAKKTWTCITSLFGNCSSQ